MRPNPGGAAASDNITYTDWQRDNYWRAILSVTGPAARSWAMRPIT